MDEEPDELAALVALLRRAASGWTDVAAEVQEEGSAVRVLARQVGAGDTLFPDNARVTELLDSAVSDIEAWRADGIDVHGFFEPGYPAQLRTIRELPPIIFARGTSEPDTRAVAVVGSRQASDDGLRMASAISAALADRGVTVVSGLASGIDTEAHRAALDTGGRTVAVIGTGIRHSYPATNRRLQQRIAESGLVISQFWPEAGPARQQFPMRNAVMSGYAAATVVVEAGQQSGARIQARLALQHGRPVVLTSRVIGVEWAAAIAHHPGVYVVGSTAELLHAVDDILGRAPAEIGLEDFPDLAPR